MTSPSSGCLPLCAGLFGRFTWHVFCLTVKMYVLLVSGMLGKSGKKGVSLRADVLLLIIYGALKLLIF